MNNNPLLDQVELNDSYSTSSNLNKKYDISFEQVPPPFERKTFFSISKWGESDKVYTTCK